MSKSILLSPHDDDSALFASFTCMREKPVVIVCLDSYIQPNRGEIGCDADTRAKETEEACKVLGCEVKRVGLRDDIDYEVMGVYLSAKLKQITDKVSKVYAPALQGGNPHHDIVSRVAKEVFGDKVIYYTTYTRTELWTKGNQEVVPTAKELDLKNKALACYVSQINLPATKPHFEAIKNKSEWLNI